MPPPLILASTSRYRRELLGRLGLPFACIAPEVDEDEVKNEAGLSPRQIAERLAERKAAAVAARHPEAVVIGSDQLGHLDGALLGKPGSAEAAAGQLATLAGRTHELVTAVCVLAAGARHAHTDIARLTMRLLSRAAIARYVAADEPADCAGGYKLERRGIALFSAIDCADHTAITGLPLLWTANCLAGLGYDLP